MRTTRWIATALAALVGPLGASGAGLPSMQPPAAQRELLGRPAGLPAEDPREQLLPAETAVFAAPTRTSAVMLVMDVAAVVEVLERAEGWLRVRYGAVSGWVALEGGAPVTFQGAAPPAPLDAERRAVRLAEASAALGQVGSEPESVAGHLWLTDLPPRAPALGRLREIAGCLAARHRERYGLAEERPESSPSPLPSPTPAIVLFARESDYRRYVERMGELDAYDTGGHAADGVAVFFAGDRDPDDLAATLAHELVHVLDARVFPFELPAWLEEGLAQDFAFAAAGSRGCPEPDAWPRLRSSEHEQVVDGRTVLVRRVRASGEGRAAACAARAWRKGDDAPRLAELVELTREEISAPEGRGRRYVAAGALVRVLLGGTNERRAAFRDWLVRRGAGEALDLRELLASLMITVEDLEREVVDLLAEHVDPRLCDARVAD